MSGNMRNKVDCCVGVQQENPIYNSICLQDPVSGVDGESRQTRKVKPLRGRFQARKTEIGERRRQSDKLLSNIKCRPADTSLLILYNSNNFNWILQRQRPTEVNSWAANEKESGTEPE